MDCCQALADLTEISSQVEAAAIFDADGAIVASRSTIAAAASASSRAVAGPRRQPTRCARPAGWPLAQLEAATLRRQRLRRPRRRAVHRGDDAARSRPSALVFYDLKTALRSRRGRARREEAGAAQAAREEEAEADADAA